MSERLYRSTRDRVFAGVCGGLAARFDLDPSIVRVGWVLVALLTAIVPLLLVYALMAIVVPEEPPGLLGSLGFNPPEGTPAAVAWRAAQDAEWAARRSARRAARERQGGDPTIAIVFGILLIAIGGAFLVHQWIAISWGFIWPVGLIAAGLLAIMASVRR